MKLNFVFLSWFCSLAMAGYITKEIANQQCLDELEAVRNLNVKLVTEISHLRKQVRLCKDKHHGIAMYIGNVGKVSPSHSAWSEIAHSEADSENY